eukprot:7386652-Prymnesium_polylepis.1
MIKNTLKFRETLTASVLRLSIAIAGICSNHSVQVASSDCGPLRIPDSRLLHARTRPPVAACALARRSPLASRWAKASTPR